MKPALFTPAAEADVEEAFQWYEAQREGLSRGPAGQLASRPTRGRHPGEGHRHVKRGDLLRKREGASHSLWCNPKTGAVEAVPRHTEVANDLARTIGRHLTVPEVAR